MQETGGKFRPQDKNSSRLQELSFMNNIYYDAMHYNIHLDMKLNFTISRIFQEMSLSELEALHYLCELERTQILQSLAVAVLKLPYAGHLLSGNRSILLNTKEIYCGITHVRKNYHHYMYLKLKKCYKRMPIFYKNLSTFC